MCQVSGDGSPAVSISVPVPLPDAILDSAVLPAAGGRLKAFTDLPIAVGFGITTPDQVAEIGSVADAAVVGSAIVRQIEANLDENGKAKPGLVDAVLDFTRTLSQGVR